MRETRANLRGFGRSYQPHPGALREPHRVRGDEHEKYSARAPARQHENSLSPTPCREAFFGAVVDDDQSRERVSPPLAEESVERKTKQYGSGKRRVNQRHTRFGHEDRIAKLLSRYALTQRQEQHGDQRRGEPGKT